MSLSREKILNEKLADWVDKRWCMPSCRNAQAGRGEGCGIPIKVVDAKIIDA